MRSLRLTICLFFTVFSAACLWFSHQNSPLANDSFSRNPQNVRTFITAHAQTFQTANAETVRGDFSNENHFEFGGVKVSMLKNEADFLFEFETAEKKEIYKIEAVAGKDNLQEYIARRNDELFRLPVAYDLERQRWLNLNSAFFAADGEEFFAHQKNWQTDCAACHLEKLNGGNQHLDGFNLKNLNADQILLVCGACHAKNFNGSFPSFDEVISSPTNAYEIVAAHRNAAQNSPDGFADGQIRLSSHEYQGILRSVCFLNNKAAAGASGGEKINCLSCHSIENGKIDVKTDEKILSQQACASCHQQFSAPQAVAEHTKHPAEAKVSCYDCHMPKIVYGHLQFQRTHEISSPNPQITAQQQIPNACNVCHVDKSVNWAITQTKTLWAERFRDAQISSDQQFDYPEGIRGLLAGDAFIRALSANNLTKRDDFQRFAPFLSEAFENEKYPLVRYFLTQSINKSESNSSVFIFNDAQDSHSRFQLLDRQTQRETENIFRRLREKRSLQDVQIKE